MTSILCFWAILMADPVTPPTVAVPEIPKAPTAGKAGKAVGEPASEDTPAVAKKVPVYPKTVQVKVDVAYLARTARRRPTFIFHSIITRPSRSLASS